MFVRFHADVWTKIFTRLESLVTEFEVEAGIPAVAIVLKFAQLAAQRKGYRVAEAAA